MNPDETRAFVESALKLDAVREAIQHLRQARELLKVAGATRATDKVRAALSSAAGAERHAELAPYRERRQADARLTRQARKAYAAAHPSRRAE